MQSLSVKVLQRFMSEREFDALYEKYKAARRTLGAKGMTTPSLQDREIARAVAKSKSIGKVAKEFGISHSKVTSAVARVYSFQ